MSLLSGGGKPPHSSFLWLLWEEEGVSFDTSERQSAVGVGDSGLYCLDLPLPDELLGGQRLQQPLHPQAFLLWKH